ncbi:MAG: hypothetical protein PWP12_1048, partial [Bacillota bacterium]|nr:hypothetical protein [Bacillota bacterium]
PREQALKAWQDERLRQNQEDKKDVKE